jgi:hypothetical protein
VAIADQYIAELTTTDVRSVSPQDTTLGRFYLVAIDVPEVFSGKTIVAAVLELNMDAESKDVNGFVNDTPILEVYALNGELLDEADPKKFIMPSSMRRNIRVGEDRRIRIDISEVVRDFIENPSNNHGLVLGSLSNSRDGLFTVRSSRGIMGKITYYFLAEN